MTPRKLRRSFQATVSNAKKNIDTDQTLEITGRQTVQLKTVYPMNKNDISADNFIPVMELQDANGCSDTSVFLEETRKCFRDFLEFVTVLIWFPEFNASVMLCCCSRVVEHKNFVLWTDL